MELTSLRDGIGETEPAAAISRQLAGLLKEHFGHGPVGVRVHVLDDCVVALFQGGSSRLERALVAASRSDLVAEVRSAIDEDVASQYTAVIERVLGRKVIGFMAGSQDEPDFACHVYVLSPQTSTNGDAPSIPS